MLRQFFECLKRIINYCFKGYNCQFTNYSWLSHLDCFRRQCTDKEKQERVGWRGKKWKGFLKRKKEEKGLVSSFFFCFSLKSPQENNFQIGKLVLSLHHKTTTALFRNSKVVTWFGLVYSSFYFIYFFVKSTKGHK